MTRLPQVLRNVRVEAFVIDELDDRIAGDVAAARAELGDARAGARSAQRHRAARAGDGRGTDRGRGRSGRRRVWPTPSTAARLLDWLILCAASSPSSGGGRLGRPSVVPTSSSCSTDRGSARAGRSVARSTLRLERAADALEEAERVARAAFPASTRCLQSPDLRAALARRHRRARATSIAVHRRGARRRRSRRCPTARARQRRARARQGRALGGRARSPAHRRGGRRPARTAPAAAPRSRRSRRCRSRSSALDRLEVRGRDSAGLHLLVHGHGLDLDSTGVRALLDQRAADPLFRNGAVRTPDGMLGFVYKAAAEIGELGDNTRRAARGDHVRRARCTCAVAADTAEVDRARPHALGERRHHLAGQRPSRSTRRRTGGNPARTSSARSTATSTTSPTSSRPKACASPRRSPPTPRSSRRSCRASCARASTLSEAFRRRSPASRARSPSPRARRPRPTSVLLALRGSGQALYVGLAEDAYIVASEPYGLVEETHALPAHGRRDAGQRRQPDREPRPDRRRSTGRGPARSKASSGSAYDGTALPVTDDDLVVAQITTRDIDRGNYRALPAEGDQRVAGVVPQDAARQARRARRPARRARSATRRCRPTCAPTSRRVASRGSSPSARARRTSRVRASRPPSESMAPDTAAARRGDARHRAVRLRPARRHERHARHRHQPVGHDDRHQPHRRPRAQPRRAGRRHRQPPQQRPHRQVRRRALHVRRPRRRDVGGVDEGALLADRRGLPARRRRSRRSSAARSTARCSQALRALPDAMAEVVERRAEIGAIAQQLAPSRRYWAIVGNGANRIAANELRIKLSELCYKSIACDSTEDKKHIDLSSEPLILVCAAGLTGSTADDVAKEVAIFRAHKATPIVIASEGEERFCAAVQAIKVPPTHPTLAFVLSAWPVTSSATRPRSPSTRRRCRCARPAAAIEAAVSSSAGGIRADGDRLLRRLRPTLESAGAALLRRPAHGRVRRPSRGVDRGAAVVAVALRARHHAARRVPGRVRQDRHAGGRRRRPHRSR